MDYSVPVQIMFTHSPFWIHDVYVIFFREWSLFFISPTQADTISEAKIKMYGFVREDFNFKMCITVPETSDSDTTHNI